MHIGEFYFIEFRPSEIYSFIPLFIQALMYLDTPYLKLIPREIQRSLAQVKYNGNHELLNSLMLILSSKERLQDHIFRKLSM